MQMREVVVGLTLGASLMVGCKKEAPSTGGAPAAEAPPAAPSAPPPRPSQGKLEPMPALERPADPSLDAKIELGHALFFDKRLSVDGSRACYSCHQNVDGTGGHDPIAIGPGDKVLTRHAPALWNLGYARGGLYWDGRAATLEDVAKGAWGGGNMAVGKENLDKKAAEIGAIAGYQPLFTAAYGDPAASADRVATALASYMRTITCTDTAYDKFARGDKAALDEAQQRGLDVFFGPGGCTACHTPPHFSIALMSEGGVYFNAGVGIAGKPDDQVDKGRMTVTSKPEDWAAFKVPSLRNIAKTPPYFHDGSVAKLEDAVHYMASGALANKNLSALFTDKKLSAEQQRDLVAFLGGLTCPGGLVEPKLP